MPKPSQSGMVPKKVTLEGTPAMNSISRERDTLVSEQEQQETRKGQATFCGYRNLGMEIGQEWRAGGAEVLAHLCTHTLAPSYMGTNTHMLTCTVI